MFDLLSVQTGVIFLLLGVGYACRKLRVYDAAVQKGLSSLVLTVALPCRLVASAALPAGDVGLSQAGTFFSVCLAYFIVGIAAFTCLARCTRLDPLRRRQFGILAVFPASAFMGMPFAAALFGEKGVFFMGMFSICYSVCQYTYGIGIYTGIRRENILRLLLNPLLIAACCMIALFALRIRLPAVMQLTLSAIGQASTPLSMFVVGGIVSERPLRAVFMEKTCYLISFCRLVVVPLAALIAFRLMRIESFQAVLLGVTFALPSSFTSAVIADKYTGDSAYSSIAVAQSMLFFLITIPGVIALLDVWWPL